MLTIAKAVLPAQSANGYSETAFRSTNLAGLSFKMNKKGEGLNFFGEDGSFHAYVRLSKAVRKSISKGELTVAQSLAYGAVTEYPTKDKNGADITLYTIVLPAELRGGDSISVAAAIAAAKPLVRKVVTLENISAELTA
jgi:hypothetical protein